MNPMHRIDYSSNRLGSGDAGILDSIARDRREPELAQVLILLPLIGFEEAVFGLSSYDRP